MSGHRHQEAEGSAQRFVEGEERVSRQASEQGSRALTAKAAR
jgi:hypothetical protein